MACVNALKPDILTACHCLTFFPLYAGEARLRRPPYARLCLGAAQSPKQPISATAEQHDQDQEEEQQLASIAEASAVAEDDHQQQEEQQQFTAFILSPAEQTAEQISHRANLL
jgi:hypothetical protein